MLVTSLLEANEVLCHPFVIGELAVGRLKDRRGVIRDQQRLPPAVQARDPEALAFIDRAALHGRGLSYIDIHLLTSARLTPGATLWTRGRRLHAAADDLNLAARMRH